MKPSEETLTAWIDDALSADDQAAFEANLPPNAEEERRQAKELGQLLRTHLKPAPPLKNAEFFTHSVLQQIAPPVLAASASPKQGSFWHPFLHFLTAAAACLAIVFFLGHTLNSSSDSDYFAAFHNLQAGDEAISAVAFHDQEAQITVLWLEGLDYLPDSQKIGAR